MIEGRKILITGVTGRVALPLALELARRNEVFGVARLRDPADRSKLEAAGIRPIPLNISQESFANLPADFDYVFHAAAMLSKGNAAAGWLDFEDTNAQAAGRLLLHCSQLRGFVYCSTGSVYQYRGQRPLAEADPPGVHGTSQYSFSKMAGESVMRWISNEHGRPVTIIRICSTYGPLGGAPADRLDQMVRGEEVVLHPDKPNFYNPIFEDDYVRHGMLALLAAKSPPEVVNWSGSETVSAEDYLRYMGALLGIEPKIKYSTAAYTPLWPDTTHMHEVLGPTRVGWREGMRRMVQARYPQRKLREVFYEVGDICPPTGVKSQST